MTPKDCYAILGVKLGASPDEIKKAYLRQVRRWHPDRHQGAARTNAEEMTKRINAAKAELLATTASAVEPNVEAGRNTEPWSDPKEFTDLYADGARVDAEPEPPNWVHAPENDPPASNAPRAAVAARSVWGYQEWSVLVFVMGISGAGIFVVGLVASLAKAPLMGAIGTLALPLGGASAWMGWVSENRWRQRPSQSEQLFYAGLILGALSAIGGGILCLYFLWQWSEVAGTAVVSLLVLALLSALMVYLFRRFVV